jgi:probable F420-dependent oxidoreductase
MAIDIGRIGVWTFNLDLQPMGRAQEAVGELEAMGYGAVWIPEAAGREVMSNAALLLQGGERIVVATGIANLWARDAMSMAAGQKTILSAHPDRFLLGIGVSHQVAVEALRGQSYERPLTRMRSYLEAMDAALFRAEAPTGDQTRVLAALGPKMLDLARERAGGAHPYFVPLEHTAVAREALGPDKLLAPEQAVVLETDPTTARRIARSHLQIYLGLPNYTNNLRRFGFGDDDLADGGSDRLVDAIVAWGDADTVAARVRAHHDAGADHVCIQVITADPRALPTEEWRELAGALGLAG